MKTMLFDFLNKIKSSTVISAGKYGIASAGDFGTVDGERKFVVVHGEIGEINAQIKEKEHQLGD